MESVDKIPTGQEDRILFVLGIDTSGKTFLFINSFEWLNNSYLRKLPIAQRAAIIEQLCTVMITNFGG